MSTSFISTFSSSSEKSLPKKPIQYIVRAIVPASIPKPTIVTKSIVQIVSWIDLAKIIKNFPIENSKIFILAQNLSPSSSLIKILSEDKYSAVISSYPKSNYKIHDEIKLILSQERVTIEKDALNLLSSSLGDDHLNSTQKLESILSFIYPKKNLSSDDIENFIYDSRFIEIDNLVFSVFSGNKIGTIKNPNA